MGRRSDHSREQIREMAVEAAERILREEGLNGLSTRKVARAIGYTVGTLYLTFRNLDDLILHVNAKTLDELYRRLQDTTEQCRQLGDKSGGEAGRNQIPADCLHALAQDYFHFARDEYARWSLLYEYQTQDEFEMPPWFSDKVEAIFQLIEQQLQALCREHKGENNHGINLQQIRLSAQVLWSGVHGVCVLALKDKLSVVSDVAVEKIIGELISIFLAGYLTKQQ